MKRRVLRHASTGKEDFSIKELAQIDLSHMELFSQTTSRTSFFFVLIFVLFASYSQVGAQTIEENNLTMIVRPGFDGIIKNENWFPVLVTLANDGPPIEGRLKISASNSGTEWVTDVSLPTQSRKQIQATVHSSGFGGAIQVSLEADSGEQILSLTNSSVQALDKSDSLIYGVVAPEPDTLELLSKVDGGRSDAAVAYLAIDEIPTDPVGMEALDVLVFNDTDTNALSAVQRESIEIWLNQGGQLVLTGGAGWQKTTAAFQDMLPVEISGTESVENLSSFESAIEVAFRDSGPYVIAKSNLRNGELFWRNEAQPILARRSISAGSVWFLSLDPQFAPLDDWDGSLVIWDSVAQFVPRPLFWERGFVNETSLDDALSTIPAIQLPSVWLILGFMGLYILMVGPLNYIVLSRIERRELAWLTLPITILLFSGVALLVGLQFRGNRVIINQLSIVSGQIDAPKLRVQSGIGIYSPSRDEFDIEFEPDVNLEFFSRFGGGGFSDSPQVTLGNETLLEDVLVSVGEVTPVTSSSFEDASPISGNAALSANGEDIELTITNESNDQIYNILLLVSSKQIRINNLSPGQTFNREIGLPFGSKENFGSEASGGPATYKLYTALTDTYQDYPLVNGLPTLIEGELPGGYSAYSYYDDPEKSQRNSFLNSLYESYNSDDVYLPEGKIVLIGWSDVPQTDVSLKNNRYDLFSTSLYFIEIPVER